jgi:hypothetical protein
MTLEDCDLDAEHFRLLTVSHRAVLTYGAININETERLVMGACLCDDRAWPEASLATYIQRPRSTVRNHVKDLLAMGLGERSGNGFKLNSFGNRVFATIVADVNNIIRGRRVGFRPELLQVLDGLTMDGVKRPFTTGEAARTIAFPKLRHMHDD